ncbi:hypothetical protein [Sphingomonas arenae]|uniref:hypothetical protein n=1 Tax=Sphingomonas arenae TaxID=2812555 RepID=UPI001967E54E|nr:hypothetical protein [Sphingomonas arenae]
MAVSLVALLVACSRQSSAPPAQDSTENAAAEVGAPPVLPTIAQPLNRRDILLAVAEAASDFSLGRDDAARQRELDGKPFSFRIRLCERSGGSLRSSFDPDTRVLRVKVRPDLARAAEVAPSQASAREESPTVEGFWVPRPWLLEPGCPIGNAPLPVQEQPSSAPEEPAQAGGRVGIAHAVGEPGARSVQRGERAYEITKTLPEGTVPGPVDLVLQGRLKGDPGRKVIRCEAAPVDRAPTCIVSALIDRVRLENQAGELLGEWSEG